MNPYMDYLTLSLFWGLLIVLLIDKRYYIKQLTIGEKLAELTKGMLWVGIIAFLVWSLAGTNIDISSYNVRHLLTVCSVIIAVVFVVRIENLAERLHKEEYLRKGRKTADIAAKLMNDSLQDNITSAETFEVASSNMADDSRQKYLLAKDIGKSPQHCVDEARYCLYCEADLSEQIRYSRKIKSSYIQYKFCPRCGRDSDPAMPILTYDPKEERKEIKKFAAIFGGLCVVAFGPIIAYDVVRGRMIAPFILKVLALLVVVIVVLFLMTPTCPNCRVAVGRGDNFCYNCGAKLDGRQ